MITPEEQSFEIAKAAAEGAGRESVSKLANVVGDMFPFWGLKKRAVETYIADIEKSNLSPEAKLLAISNTKKTYKQLKNQVAIAQIAQSVASEGTDFSEKSDVDDEWLERFMDSAKFVSDEQVQLLWGNILAKEFEAPNSTPPSVIRILSEITPVYAKAFQTLCSLTVHIIPVDKNKQLQPSVSRVILPQDYDYLNKYGLNFSVLSELQMLGLIQFDPVAGFILILNSEQYPRLHLIYGQDTATVLKYPNKKLPIGTALLTEAGWSIARFITPSHVDEHLDAVCGFLRKKQVEFSEIPEIKVQ